MTQVPRDNPMPDFSPQLRDDVERAIEAYLSQGPGAAGAQMRETGEHVCAEAKAIDLPAEKMIVLMHRILEQVPRTSGDVLRRQAAYETLITACIKSYFGAH